MAVARTPNTRANFGRATRLPHRRVRVLRVGWTILSVKNRTDFFASTLCAKVGEVAAHLYLHQLPDTIIEYQVRFWRGPLGRLLSKVRSRGFAALRWGH